MATDIDLTEIALGLLSFDETDSHLYIQKMNLGNEVFLRLLDSCNVQKVANHICRHTDLDYLLEIILMKYPSLSRRELQVSEIINMRMSGSEVRIFSCLHPTTNNNNNSK